MAAERVLLIAPGTASVGPHVRVAGVPLIRRIVLAAGRAGFDRVLIHRAGDGIQRLIQGTVAQSLDRVLPLPERRRRIVLLSSDVVPGTDWLRRLLAEPIEPDTLYADTDAVAMVESEHPSRLLTAVAAGTSAGEMIRALERSVPATAQTTLVPTPARLSSIGDVPRAERWLLRGLIKQNEGFMSRHVERRLSLAITRRLMATGVTPNAMTLVSLAIGLAGAPFFLSPAPQWQLPGALLFLLHSIVDGCDGELARLKFLESRVGATLDFWGDNVVHVAVFGCIAAGWYLATGAPWPLLLGAVSILSTLGTAAVVSRRQMQDASAVDGGSLTGRLLSALAHRDFIYVVVALAAMGKAAWFLVLSAVGTPLFLGVLLASTLRAGRSPSR